MNNLAFLIASLGVAAGICLSYLFVGKATSRTFILSLLLFSVPLLAPANSRTSFLFAADLLVTPAVAFLLFRGQDLIAGSMRNTVLLVAFLLIGTNSMGTLIGVWLGEHRQLGQIAICAYRYFGYLIVFSASLILGRRKYAAVDQYVGTSLCVWMGLCVAGSSRYIFNLPIDAWSMFDEQSLSEQMNAYGAGTLGLYRGEIGAISVLMCTCAGILYSRGGKLQFIAILATVSSIGLTLCAGSRQGTILSSFAFFGSIPMGLLFQIRAQEIDARTLVTRVMKLAIFVCLGLLILIFTARKYLDVDYLATRFGDLVDFSHSAEMAKERDPRFGNVWYHIGRDPGNYIVGVGCGRMAMGDNDAIVLGKPFDLIYVDSEFLWSIQQGGLIQIVTYASLLFFLFRIGLRGSRRSSGAGAYLCSILVFGGMLIYGHFFLLHVQSSNAIMGYASWSLIGLSIGRMEIDNSADQL